MLYWSFEHYHSGERNNLVQDCLNAKDSLQTHLIVVGLIVFMWMTGFVLAFRRALKIGRSDWTINKAALKFRRQAVVYCGELA